MTTIQGLSGSQLLRVLVDRREGPFTNSMLWPPLDESGFPKPVLTAVLLTLSVLMFYTFYDPKMKAALKEQVHAKKKVMRVAQTTNILIGQLSTFRLDEEHSKLLEEVDATRPAVYQGREDLTVKGNVRVPLLVDLKLLERELDGFLHGPSSPPEVPESLPLLERQGSDDVGGLLEMPLKGRVLKEIKVAGKTWPVRSVSEVAEVYEEMAGQKQADPAEFVLESSPPEASRLFMLLVDKAYQERVADMSLFSSSERDRFLILEKLFRKRVRVELEEGIQKTRQARGMPGAQPVLPEQGRLLPPYHSGQLLKEIVELVRGTRSSSGAREFFDDLVPSELLECAEETLRQVAASRASRMSLIFGLVRPALPWWLVAVVTHSLLEVVVAQLNTAGFCSKLLELIQEKKIDQTGVILLGLQWFAGWFVLKIWGWGCAHLFNGKADRCFGHGIRLEALRALLKQDFEFFDKYSGAALHARLQGDVEQLKHYLLHTSRELISEGTAIIANAAIVYSMTPFDMFAAAMLPLPFITLGQLYLIKIARKWDRQAHFMRQESEGNIGQLLGEFKTVRDFAMEGREVEKYDKDQLFMLKVEEDHASKREFIGHGCHMLHLMGEATTIIVGMKKVADGEMRGGELVLVVAMLGGMVGGKIRGMVDRLRDLSQALEPAGRICELILQAPSIEPSRADQAVLASGSQARDQVMAALSEAGQVVRQLPVEDDEGVDVVVGARLTVVGTNSGDAIALVEDAEATWEVVKRSDGNRLEFYASADLQQPSGRKAAKAGCKLRGVQVSECAVRIGDEFVPLQVGGEFTLRLVAAGKRHLLPFLETRANDVYPLKFFFTRKQAPMRFKGHIEFQNVEFRYPTELRVPALRDLTFSIEAGKMAALVGHAGCGKSTIFKLIKRLYDPTVGNILLDGHNLKEYDLHHLRRKIAVVAQENVLFDTSLVQNVTYGVYPEPSDDEVREALRQASALEFVEAFPDNIHTQVGSRGLTLSGGQRQRVAIARAMVRAPQILILDEATSALDPANEKIVQAALDALIKNTGATALIIAHRLTTVKDCDKILVFDEGRMVESGSHAELMKIPVERHPPRGKQEVGPIKTGFFHSQWDHMMGEEPKPVERAPDPGSELEMARLKAQVHRLQRGLELEQLWSMEKARQVTSLTSALAVSAAIHLDRARSDSAQHQAVLPPRCEEICAHTEDDLSAVGRRRAFGCRPEACPTPLSLGQRLCTA